MEREMITLGLAFAEVTGKNTISYIKSKMDLAKQKKTLDEQSLAYTEIINNLLEDKAELTTIAREYKQELEQVVISEEDIEHLHKTMRNAFKLLGNLSDSTEDNKGYLDVLIELLNKDTLKTMQLLGFNYKEAIGVPLTKVCSDFITTKLSTNSKGNSRKK